jgi:hypothetical protein
MLAKGPATPDLVIAALERRAPSRHRRAKKFLPLLDRLRTNGLAIEMKKVEGEKDEGIAVASVRGVWIRLKEVVPSGRAPHSSPSRYAWLTGSDDNAEAIAGYHPSSRARCGLAAERHPGLAGHPSGGR